MANQEFLIRTVFDLVGLLTKDEIFLPTDYRNMVLVTKKSLQDDTSGLINTLLDLKIKSACVNYTVETTNPALTEILNKWLENINEEFVGQIPVGYKSLAKEFFRERWKGSSMCLVRSVWQTIDGFTQPTKMWLVDGEDIIVEDSSEGEAVILGNMTYFLRVGNSNEEKDRIRLLNSSDHHYFVQKPYCSWTTRYPVPFSIQRGLYENGEFLKLLIKKGEKITNRAIEYLFNIKKGTEAMALKGTADTIYDDKDLKEIKEKFKTLIQEQSRERGVPIHVSNFDTEFSEYMPDLKKVIARELYEPAEKRILNGLGVIELMPSGGTNRREASFNPLPFVSEVEQGIEDFATFLTDVLRVMVRKNRNHPKYNGQILRVNHTPVTKFISADILDHLRSGFDRGVLSKQTYVEILGQNYEVQRNRRIHEEENGDEEIMYPPVTQNVEAAGQDSGKPTGTPATDTKDSTPPDKTGVEKKNFQNNSLEISCRNGHKFQVEKAEGQTTCNCPECREEVNY